MAKNLGYTRIWIPGLSHILNRPVVIQVGGKNLDDIVDELSKQSEDTSKGSAKREPVEDIEKLSAKQLDELRCGDVVIKQSGTEQHAYHVAYKDDTKHEISLVYADAWNVEEIYYDKSVGGVWSMIEKKITAIATPEQSEPVEPNE